MTLLPKRRRVLDQHGIHHRFEWVGRQTTHCVGLRSGSADDSRACFTVLRCTPCRAASPRTDKPSTRASLRISANNSTRDSIQTSLPPHPSTDAANVESEATNSRHTMPGGSRMGPEIAVPRGPSKPITAARSGARSELLAEVHERVLGDGFGVGDFAGGEVFGDPGDASGVGGVAKLGAVAMACAHGCRSFAGVVMSALAVVAGGARNLSRHWGRVPVPRSAARAGQATKKRCAYEATTTTRWGTMAL